MSALTRAPSAINIPRSTINLTFTDNPAVDHYKVFEVSEAILAEIEACAGTDALQIKGAPNDEAVLVTHNNTYAIRCAETSNTVILASITNTPPHPTKKPKLDTDVTSTQQEQQQAQLHGFITKHYELDLVQPRLHRLRDILHQSVVDDNNTSTAHLYTLADLHKLIQCSAAQLDTALAQLGALCIDGYWRILNPDYQAKVFDLIVNAILQHRQSIDAVDVSVIHTALANLYDAHIVTHVLQQYAVLDSATGKYKLDKTKVCLFKAIQLFAKREPYPHTAFVADWSDALPHAITPDTAMLLGHAIHEPIPYSGADAAVKRTGSTAVGAAIDMSHEQWRYFPVTSLSSNTRERFAQLFVAKPKWTLGEVTPYVSDICPSALTVEKFVMKNSRAINEVQRGTKVIVYMKK